MSLMNPTLAEIREMKLRAEIEVLRDLLIESEAMLCDVRAGETGNKLAEKIITALNPDIEGTPT